MEDIAIKKEQITRKSKTMIYTFKYGLPGFENLNEYRLEDLEDYPPFKLFKSCEDDNISMIVIDGELLEIFPEIQIPKKELIKLEISDSINTQIYIILRIDEDTKEFVANTKAPLILNTDNGLGNQIILESKILSVKHPMKSIWGTQVD